MIGTIIPEIFVEAAYPVYAEMWIEEFWIEFMFLILSGVLSFKAVKFVRGLFECCLLIK